MELIALIIIGYFGYRWYVKIKRGNHIFGQEIKIIRKDTEDDYIGIQQGERVGNSKHLNTDKSPFLIANSLLTNAELNFYKVLKNVIPENQIICPKVRMQDVLWTKTYKIKDKQIFINKVNRKHFDFVICDKNTFKPLMAVELDDKSHEEEERKERDEFVDALFTKSLGFRVVHIPVRYNYDTIELQKELYPSNQELEE